MAFGNVDKGDEFRVENNGGTASTNKDCWVCDSHLEACVLVEMDGAHCTEKNVPDYNPDGGALVGKPFTDSYVNGLGGKARCQQQKPATVCNR